MSDVALSCTLGGSMQTIMVCGGHLRLPQAGPGVALLHSSGLVAPAERSPASLLFHRPDGGTDTFVGSIRRAKVDPGTQDIVISWVGGAGGLLTPLPPLDHTFGAQPVPAGVVARAICDAAGEVLAPGVEQALDAYLLPRWHRATDTSGAVALDLLAYQLGLSWRVLASGFVWLGAETWTPVTLPTGSAAPYWQGIDGDDGGTLYATLGAPFAPGQSVSGVQVIDALYMFTGSSLGCEIRGAVTGDPPHVPDLDLYRASYGATVIAQRGDGTIDVACDDARIGHLLQLKVLVGLPGALVTFDPTTTPPPRVRVAFEGASPAGAYATAPDQDSGASSPMLRVVDAALLAFDPGVPGTTPPALFRSLDAGASWQVIELLGPGTTLGGTVPPPPAPATPGTSIVGAGSSRVKLR